MFWLVCSGVTVSGREVIVGEGTGAARLVGLEEACRLGLVLAHESNRRREPHTHTHNYKAYACTMKNTRSMQGMCGASAAKEHCA